MPVTVARVTSTTPRATAPGVVRQLDGQGVDAGRDADAALGGVRLHHREVVVEVPAAAAFPAGLASLPCARTHQPQLSRGSTSKSVRSAMLGEPMRSLLHQQTTDVDVRFVLGAPRLRNGPLHAWTARPQEVGRITYQAYMRGGVFGHLAPEPSISTRPAPPGAPTDQKDQAAEEG